MTRTPHTPWRHLVVTCLGLAAALAVVVMAFLWPSVTADAQDVPVAVVGDQAVTDALGAALDERAPGAFALTPAQDRAAAVELIESRDVYGAVVLGAEPEVLTASAASPVVAQTLAGLAPVLQAQLTAAAQAQGVELAAPITVAVTDVVPLSTDDPRGVVLGAATFPLVLGGILGGVVISTTVVGARRRVTAVGLYAVVAGLGVTAVLQGWFGALVGPFWADAAAVGLALLAISGVIVGFTAVVGRRGVALGPVLFLLVANPISASAMPVEMIASPWGAVGQWFPPGAGSTLLRDLSYFPAAPTAFPWLVLAGWAVLGLVLALVGHVRDAGAATGAALAEAVD
ncbi:hypothetical protein [Cellulomonas soli]|uniref:Membrane protein n=1 Tax=Cellulomonas soli TaxID=931535 RepID=A0A512PBZ3_9CELL|nr:hypothetical protein [Cellulomonas soli]NYI58266.1 hypothetical protein [Cellulomonas soli]GEP68686.1 membrane protein [Cellulomonas soli]